MSILSFQNVTKVYPGGPAGVRALVDVSLDVEAGQMVGVVGVSGSGKTTLLNLAGGLDAPSEGVVVLQGKRLGEMGEASLARLRRTHAGFVFQSLNLIHTLCARENIEIPLALTGCDAAQCRERAGELLERAGLADRAAAMPHQLSAGEQQRVAALRAVAHRPAVVLLDEPTSNLDTDNADTLMDLLDELNRSEGMTMIFATHDVRLAEKLHRTVRLRDGSIVDDQPNAPH